MMSPYRTETYLEAPILPCEILSSSAYAFLRDSIRRTMKAYRSLRRIHLGHELTLLFEDRMTVLFHIHEVLHIEGIWTPKRIRQEIDTYAALVPTKPSVTATVMLDRGGPDVARDFSARLKDHRALELQIGSERIPAMNIDGDVPDEEPVRYIRFDLNSIPKSQTSTPNIPISVRKPDALLDVQLKPELSAQLMNRVWPSTWGLASVAAASA